MAEFYQQLSAKEPHVTFHYVSASPWQLYPALTKFLDTYHFPQGSFYLRLFRWKDENFFTVFQSSKPHKIETIEHLLQWCPQRRFILVGDSGEQDAEIYAMFALKYPGRINHIFIHEVPRKNGDKLDYQSVFKGIPATQWTVFTEAESLLSKKP
jgi:phosphatidate phosphatase APP1